MQLLPLFIVMFFMGLIGMMSTSFNNKFNDVQYQSKSDISFGQALMYSTGCMSAGQALIGYAGNITTQQVVAALPYSVPNVNFNANWSCSAFSYNGGRILVAFMPQMAPGGISEITLNGQQDETWKMVMAYSGNAPSYTITQYKNMVTGLTETVPPLTVTSNVPSANMVGSLVKIEGVTR